MYVNENEEEGSTHFKREQVLPIAERIYEVLHPYCLKIAIAGSLRRKKSWVKDIEIVVQPKAKTSQKTLLGESITVKNWIEDGIRDCYKNQIFGQTLKDGDKFKQFYVGKAFDYYYQETLKLDLFIVTPPAQFGTIFLIRTGSSEYSKGFVTEIRKRGYYIEKGTLRRGDPVIRSVNDEVIDTPQEAHVYRTFDWKIPLPHERTTFKIHEHIKY